MANTEEKNVQISKVEFTPLAKAHYAKVNTIIDNYKDRKRYCINLLMDKETAAPLMKKCAEWEQMLKNDPSIKGQKWNPVAYPDYNIGYKVMEDGTVDFRFRTDAFQKDLVTKELKQKHIIIFDKYGKAMDKDVSIGDGSTVIVRFSVGGYYMNSANHGINLYLDIIMVDKLISGGVGDTSGFHFAAAPSPQEVMGSNENGADGADNGSGEPSVDDDPFA